MQFISKLPRVGDKRERKKFAWLPTEINCELVVWLESYIIFETYALDYYNEYYWRETYRSTCAKTL